jgi:acyl carrier protein
MFKFLKRKQPQTAREAITRIFRETLDLETVPAEANFFELGGDSMLATLVVTALDEAGHSLPSTAVFDHPTINSLVHYIESGGAPPSAGNARTIQVMPRAAKGSTRLRASLLQERLWPYERNPDPHRFQLRGEGAALLKGPLDLSRLQRCLNLLAERHEVLRSSFVEENETLIVEVHQPEIVSLKAIDAEGDSQEEKYASAARLVADVTAGVFDLSHPPPFRCALIKISETEHVLAVSMHHIISDGWSMGIFVGEIAKIYDALVHAEPPALPELPYQFADYAAWHRDWSASEAGQASLEFWRSYLRGLPPALDVPLPADKPRQSVFNFPVRRTDIPVHAETQTALRVLAKATQTSVHTVFLASFLAAFQSLNEVTDLPIGIMHANRNTPGTQNLIGFFSTLVTLRFDLTDTASGLSAMIAKVREATRTVEPHSGVPIGVLMDEGIVDTLPRVFVDSVPRPAMETLTLEDFPFEHPPLFAVADIAVFLFDNGSDLTCLLGTNEDMFSAAAAARLAGALEQTLAASKDVGAAPG